MNKLIQSTYNAPLSDLPCERAMHKAAFWRDVLLTVLVGVMTAGLWLCCHAVSEVAR